MAGTPDPGVTYVLQNSLWTAPGRDSLSPDTGYIAGWGTPIWRDEFDYTDSNGDPAFDPAKWNVRTRTDGANGMGLLFDASVIDRTQSTVLPEGVARLRAEWLNTPVYGGDDPSLARWHKTGYIEHRAPPGNSGANTIYSQQYGRWEIRCKTPTGPKTYGSLAAFWLRNSNTGEIDIMEAWGYNEVAAAGGQRINTATTTVHSQTSGGGNQKYVWTHADYGGPANVWQDFHTYALEFTPDRFTVTVDGNQLFTAIPATHPNLWNPSFFGSPLHVRINLHVGPSATYWGLPDPNNKSWTMDPMDYLVDYVRIWEYQP